MTRKRTRIGIYLPPQEPLCDFTGGALSTWTREVYSRLAEKLDATVYATTVNSSIPGVSDHVTRYPAFSERILGLIRNRTVFGMLRSIKSLLRNSYPRYVGNAMKSQQYALIHVHNAPEATIALRRRNRRSKIVLHLNNEHLSEENFVASGIPQMVVKSTDYFAFCSEFIMHKALESIPELKTEQCFIVRNGATVSESTSDITPQNENRTFEILFVGRLVHDKGVHVLVEAMKRIVKELPDVKLKIVGGISFGSTLVDDYITSLRRDCSSIQHAVEFTGPLPHKDIVGVMHSADLLVCPSIWNDPFPLVVLEAMASGLPVIATRSGGIPEAVGEAGILVGKNDAEALANAVIYLRKSPEIRNQLSSNAKKRISQFFDWSIIADNWLMDIQEIVERTGLVQRE